MVGYYIQNLTFFCHTLDLLTYWVQSFLEANTHDLLTNWVQSFLEAKHMISLLIGYNRL